MNYSSICEIGGRAVNEDSAACLVSGDRCCFVVADGLGGHEKGEVAANIATGTFTSEFAGKSTGEFTDGSTGKTTGEFPGGNGSNGGNGDNISFLAGAFDSAQQRIINTRQKDDEMKTTCVALSISSGRFAYGYIGDSRLYHFRRTKLIARTLDHSVPQMLALAGEIREDEIRRHPDRGKLVRAMGDKWDVPRYELSSEKRLSKGDAFLLCTDGFWEHIPTSMMVRALAETRDAEEWLRVMRDIVEAAGDEFTLDNYTAITVIVREHGA